jgi:hypothetical protein
MSIRASIVLDSISPTGKRITTFSLEYPRFVHAELMTHRKFSRNASSSRAIPVAKQLKRILQDPAVPIHWGSNQPGMQADDELTGWRRALAIKLFLGARFPVLAIVWVLMKLGLHKQLANRLLEPWMHIAVVLTSTQDGLNNFYNLRYHKAAQPEIRQLAIEMFNAQKASVPQKLGYGEWHLPFVTKSEILFLAYPIDILKRISAARCARVSYLTHEGKTPKREEDLKLFDRLMAERVKHASPPEHQATPAPSTLLPNPLCGNFDGWIQFRKTIPGEFLPDFEEPTL